MFFIHCICGSPMRTLNKSDPSIKICKDTDCLAISKSSTEIIRTIRKCSVPTTEYIHKVGNNFPFNPIPCPTCKYNALYIKDSSEYTDFNNDVPSYMGIYTVRNVYLICRHCNSRHSGMVAGISMVRSLKEINV